MAPYDLLVAKHSSLKNSEKLLIDADKIKRMSNKEIVDLPHDFPNDKLYGPKNLRGLEVIKMEWETYLQYYNIARSLLKIDDDHLQVCRDLESEKRNALQQLNIPLNGETL